MQVRLKQNPVLIHSNDRSEDVMKSVFKLLFYPMYCIIAIFHQVLQYDFSGNIHSYCKMNLPLYFNCLKLLGLLDSEFLGDRAAEGVGVVLTVYEDVLNPSMHANIRMLYKQRFFTENSRRLTEGFQNASAGKFILQLTKCYIQFVMFWRFYQKRLVLEISSVWIVAQCEGMCMILKNEQKY